MGQNGVCVGAYDVDRHKSIRLLDANGYNQSSTFPLDLFDVVKATYVEKPNITPPHTEDVMLKSYSTYQNSEEVVDLFIAEAQTVDGSLLECFDGKLFQPTSGALAVRANDLPDHSVCFWNPDKPLNINNFGDKYLYKINPFRTAAIKYVGIPEAVPHLASNQTLRLSLSRKWAYNGGEELCWLQLSGWYGEP